MQLYSPPSSNPPSLGWNQLWILHSLQIIPYMYIYTLHLQYRVRVGICLVDGLFPLLYVFVKYVKQWILSRVFPKTSQCGTDTEIGRKGGGYAADNWVFLLKTFTGILCISSHKSVAFVFNKIHKNFCQLFSQNQKINFHTNFAECKTKIFQSNPR